MSSYRVSLTRLAALQMVEQEWYRQMYVTKFPASGTLYTTLMQLRMYVCINSKVYMHFTEKFIVDKSQF